MVERQGSKYAILGMLSLRPMSGYDIRKTVQESIRFFWSESYGQIYPALKRLEAQKLVERARGAQKGRAGRQVYALTRTGRRELQEWLTRKPQMQPFRNELLLKLFFGRLAPREACQEHLRHFRQRQEDFLRTYRQVEGWLHTEHERHPDLPFWLMTLTYGVHQARALRDWCDETLAALEKSGKVRNRRKRG
jgi:PadR family transcriptional regulator, regulatory protein AphA